MRNNILLLAVLLYSSNLLRSQNYSHANYSQNQYAVNTVAPTVASLMKAIDNPVGIYNGTPNISHEIFTLRDGHVVLPIILSYTSSGIKVNEEASWVGLGWNLNVGGMIAHNAVGRIDNKSDYMSGKNYFPTDEFPTYNVVPSQVGDKNKYDSFFYYGKEERLQPDVYYFSYPEGSGKFCYNYFKDSIYTLDASQQMRIISKANSGNGFAENWEIVTGNGTVHKYEGQCNVRADGRTISIITNLIQTTLPNGQQIKYYYSPKMLHKTDSYREFKNKLMRYAAGVRYYAYDLNSSIQRSISTISIEENFLDSIVTDNYTILFKKSAREDYENGKKLDEIVIRCKHAGWNIPDKRFKLEYEYAISYNTSSKGFYHLIGGDAGYQNLDRLCRRLMLSSVYETDNAGHKNNKLSFSYNRADDLPLKTSFSIDYWGYYNGKNNQYIIPNFSQLYWKLDEDIAKNQTIYGDRSCDTVLVACGMLNKIYYQTGGTTAFTYESHKYAAANPIPPFASNTDYSFDLYDRNSPSDTPHKTIYLRTNQRMELSIRLERGLCTWNQVSDANYKIVFSRGGQEQIIKSGHFSPLNNTQTVLTVEENIDIPLEGTYGIYLDLPDELGNQVGSSTNHAELSAKVTIITKDDRRYNYGGGVRIKRVDYYDDMECAKLLESYSYQYPDDAGKLRVPLAFHFAFNELTYVQGYYDNVSGMSRKDSVSINKSIANSTIQDIQVSSQTSKDLPIVRSLRSIYIGENGEEALISSDNVHSCPYSSNGANVGYSTVTVTRNNDKGLAGYTKYDFVNVSEASLEYTIQIARQGNGLPLSTTQYDKDGTIVMSEDNTYSTQRAHYICGTTVIDKFNRSPEFYTTGSTLSGYSLLDDRYNDYYNRFTTIFYPVNCEKHLLTSKKTYKDGVYVTEKFTYDDRCQVTNATFVKSDGKTHSVTYRYPYYYTSGDVEKNMVAKNMIEYPVEIIEHENGTIVDGTFTKYACPASGNYVWPLKVYRLNSKYTGGAATSYTNGNVNTSYYPYINTEYSNFDTHGNPTRIVKDGIVTVYVWGYGYQYPVAEITGSTYSQVQGIIGYAPESHSSRILPDNSMLTKLRNHATIPAVTYTWKPLYGMESLTRPNGDSSTFIYDTFGRLTKVLDRNGKTLQENIYHYKQ